MSEEKEFSEFEEILDADDKKLLEDNADILDIDEIEDIDDILIPENDNNYDEVLKLTEYDGNLVNQNPAIVAEYNPINIVNIDKKHKNFAKSFVSKITKFIIDFKDVELTEQHQDYLKQVGQLQFEHLQDLLSLVEINRSMLNNIILRVNSVQAEDYAMIASYTALMTQQLKLLKELQSTYKIIPNIIKKMKTDVLCNQELLPGDINNENGEVITESFGTTQFNNSKHLLKTLKENYTNENK